jgi:hypothetical protein
MDTSVRNHEEIRIESNHQTTPVKEAKNEEVREENEKNHHLGEQPLDMKEIYGEGEEKENPF